MCARLEAGEMSLLQRPTFRLKTVLDDHKQL